MDINDTPSPELFLIGGIDQVVKSYLSGIDDPELPLLRIRNLIDAYDARKARDREKLCES